MVQRQGDRRLFRVIDHPDVVRELEPGLFDPVMFRVFRRHRAAARSKALGLATAATSFRPGPRDYRDTRGKNHENRSAVTRRMAATVDP